MTRPDGPVGTKTAIVLVGLPARGKTYTARKIARYLEWRGYDARVFNVGNYRRQRVGARQPHSFFDPDNPEGRAARRQMARAAMDDLLAWFAAGGEVGIYDATNSTRRRRAWVWRHLQQAGLEVVFVEIVCDDAEIIENNIRETKLLSPDYAEVDPEEAVRDFRARIAHYEEAYEPMTPEEGLPFVKWIDVGREVLLHEVQGYLPSRVVFFLMNLHVTPRPILLTRHGQSSFNLEGRIGGDTGLSPAGRAYADSLAAFVAERFDESPEVWTSTLLRSRETAEPLGRDAMRWRVLDEIGSGVCDGLTYAEIRARFPEDHAARKADKLRYRYPRGESYQDVMSRLEPVILELERQRHPVLVISHQAVLRALYGYLTRRSPDDIPHLEIPLHTVIELRPRAYGVEEQRFPLEPRVKNTGSS